MTQLKKSLTLILTFTILIVFSNSLTCPDGQFQATITGGSSTACIPSQAMVWDCVSYESSSPYTCTCLNADTTVENLFGSALKGCIPKANKRINCEAYVRNAANSYSCIKCPTSAPNIVQTDASALYPSACAQDLIPGCLINGYKQYTLTNSVYIIGCAACDTAIFTGYSTFNQNFDYLGAGNTQNNGKSCPAAGQVPDSTTTCPAAKLNPNDKTKYLCAACTAVTQALFIYTAGSTPASQCVTLADTLPAVTYQPDCIEYDTTATKNCVKCNAPNPLLITLHKSDDGTPPNVATCIPSASQIKGCTLYVSVGNMYYCQTCDADSVFIPYDTSSLTITATVYPFGTCVGAGRFTLVTLCTEYDTVLPLATSLTCKTCSAGGNGDFCVATETCAGNLPKVKVEGQDAVVCVSGTLTQNCDTYGIKSGVSAPYTVSKCTKCIDGYVIKNSGSTVGGAVVSVCIDQTTVIQNCQTYDNLDLTKCLLCKGGAAFDQATSKCTQTISVTAACTKVAVRTGVTVCVQCPPKYNLVLAGDKNVCILRVQHCQTQDLSSGLCKQCVPNHILIQKNNVCVKEIKECGTYTTDGVCQICKVGFKFNQNSNQCIKDNSKTENTCPSGQIPDSNGNCVAAIKIDKCFKYLTDGTCDQCQAGFQPIRGRIGCKLSETCPPANPAPGMTYRKNARGQCIAISDKCGSSSTDYNEDGSCRNCKQGFYPYRGLCYAI